MKAILEFDLNDENDVLRHKQMFAAQRVLSCVWDIQTELRDIAKYSREGFDLETVTKVRELIRGHFSAYNIDLDELYP